MATRAAKDPVVKSTPVGDAYPEGTHPARPVSETSLSADKLTYEDMSAEMKPDPSTVAQVQVVPEGWPGH